MNIIKKLFNKYNIKPEENEPVELYGVPSPISKENPTEITILEEENELEKQYSVEPSKNIPVKLYGVPNIDNIVLNNTSHDNKESKMESEESSDDSNS